MLAGRRLSLFGATCLILMLAVIAPASPDSLPEIVAHRGASFDAPENTLASVRLAWEQNADGVEVDVYLTSDNKVVCYHDEELQRTSGDPRPIAGVSLAELRELEAGAWKHAKWAGEPIPLLKHILMTVPEGKRIFVEIKIGPEITPYLVKVVRESGLAPEQVVFISFNDESCTAIKKAMPEHQVYYLRWFEKQDDGSVKPTIDELIAEARSLGVDGIDISHTAGLTPESVAKIKDAGLFLAVWTVNDMEMAKRLRALGVQSLTTDKPGLMRETFAQATKP